MAPLPPFPWIDVVIILALIVLNGLFAMAEMAIVSSRRARLEAMAKAGRRGARAALALKEAPGKFLSTTQVGITLIAIVAGAYSGANLGEPTAMRLARLGLAAGTARTLGYALVIGLTTYASVVIGELVPKQIALRQPEPIAVLIALPMQWLARLTAPAETAGAAFDDGTTLSAKYARSFATVISISTAPPHARSRRRSHAELPSSGGSP